MVSLWVMHFIFFIDSSFEWLMLTQNYQCDLLYLNNESNEIKNNCEMTSLLKKLTFNLYFTQTSCKSYMFVLDMSLLLQTNVKIWRKLRRRKLYKITIQFLRNGQQTISVFRTWIKYHNTCVYNQYKQIIYS